MVHNHPPPESCEFLVENKALEPGRQQMARVSRVLEPPRNVAGRKRPASSLSGDLILDSSTTSGAVRRKSGGPQRNHSGDTRSSDLAEPGLAPTYGADYQRNFALNPPIFGPPAPHVVLSASSAHSSPNKQPNMSMPTAGTHPITAQLLSLGADAAAAAAATATPGQLPPQPSHSVQHSALMQPIHGHAPSLGAIKSEFLGVAADWRTERERERPLDSSEVAILLMWSHMTSVRRAARCLDLSLCLQLCRRTAATPTVA